MNNLSNFPNGASSFGIPLYPYSNLIHTGSTTQSGQTNAIGQKHYWVNGNFGSDGNDGLSPATPLLTMAACFLKLNSGDIIHFTGNITEQLQTPVGIFDVTIIGEGNLPRHADTHSTDNGYTAATWKFPSSPVASTPLLDILQQGWRVVNVLFSGSLSATAQVRLFRNGGAASLERDASHAHFVGCRFDGGVYGIQDSGGCAFVQIQGCLFRGMTTAIHTVAGAGIGTLLDWNIQGNRFFNNTNHLIAGLAYGTVQGNIFGAFTTKSIDLTGGSSNMIFLNTLSGTYSNVGGYTASGAADEWGGNANVIAGGWTAADPA